MNKFLRTLCTLISILVIVAVTVFLVLKIKNDTLAEKDKDIEDQNIEAESEYMCDTANEKITAIKEKIEKDTGVEVELADVGSVNDIDIYFVTKVDGEYKYIIKENTENEEKFAVAQDNEDDAKYIVSINMLGLDECVYTSITQYVIDKEANISFLGNI